METKENTQFMDVDLEPRAAALPAVHREAEARRQSSASATPADLLRMAMDQGADLDRLERLMDMQERWLKREAEMAFIEAMTAFKIAAPRINKNQTADFMGKNGRVVYDFSDLGNVVNAAMPLLAAQGFSHSWVPDQTMPGKLTITCVLTHIRGHKELRTLTAAHDESGSKNAIQGMNSTATYLERITLLMACGLAVSSGDDDGASQQTGTETAPDAAAWVAKANAAPNKQELESVWKSGAPKLQAVNDQAGLNELSDACNKRLDEITAAKATHANKSSRLHDIVKPGQTGGAA